MKSIDIEHQPDDTEECNEIVKLTNFSFNIRDITSFKVQAITITEKPLDVVKMGTEICNKEKRQLVDISAIVRGFTVIILF